MKISINANRCEPSPMRKFHPLAVKAKKAGAKIYHLNIGQPDIATPQAFYDAVKNFDETTLAYDASPGAPLLMRQSVIITRDLVSIWNRKTFLLRPVAVRRCCLLV